MIITEPANLPMEVLLYPSIVDRVGEAAQTIETTILDPFIAYHVYS